MKAKKTVERIYLSKTEFLKNENEIRFHEHMRRYAAVRRFCYGEVLDFACGCGYGSYLLAANPEIKSIVSVDINENAIAWAKKEYAHSKIKYFVKDISKVKKIFDTIVSLETIEHIEKISLISDLVKRCRVDNLILCFPDKKSTHFNSFHFHDFVLQDVIDIFPSHVCYHTFRSGDVQFVLLIRLPEKAVPHIFRNIRDL